MSQFLRNTALIGAVSFGLMSGGAAYADVPPGGAMEPPPADSLLSGVTVSVPKTIETTRYGIRSQEVFMSVRVPYGDLDMKSAAGVATLQKRVTDAGTYICRQLAIMYPVGTPDNYGCVRDAVKGAEPQIIKASAPG